MATIKRSWKLRTVILLIYFSAVMHFVDSDTIPDRFQVKDWTEKLSKRLHDGFTTVNVNSAYTLNQTIQDIIDRTTKDGSIKVHFEKIDPEAIVAEMSRNLADMLGSKMLALNRSVKAAEKAAGHHNWTSNIENLNQEELLKSKEIKPDDPLLEYSDRFKQNIIPNMSSVHIPVEIYDGDVEILNGLQWSGALDKVFYENFQKDDEILWQYFGSQSGFMRTLPASRWDTGGEVDLYDVRRRPWYTQGSSSPKDMLILIDTSGSVHGQALELMKVAVKSLLDTLGENDFVNIARFSEKAESVSTCFGGTFVQANYRNKQKLIDEVDQIQATQMADFSKGLTFAFQQFEQLKNESKGRRGAECNRMIMLLTDGGTEHAEEVFDKFNPEGNKTYRLFSYAVGPTANPISAIRWMACANRGYFSQIPAMGAVRSKVQGYVDVISRPLALNQVNSGLWTSIYQGIYEVPRYMDKPVHAMEMYTIGYDERLKFVVKHDPRGLGMMTTVTLPVYNKTVGTSNQTILGVMGIDVTTDAMLKRAPLRKFGPNGFPFAINSNGYIVFHPNLKIPKDLVDPPNIDLLEVEVESTKKEQLRADMIDMKTGNVTMDTLIIANDERHVAVETGSKQRRYSYIPIDKTSFSVGVCIPKYHQYHMTVTADIARVISHSSWPKDINTSAVALLIANWEYYENFTSGNITGTVLDLLPALENPSQYKWDNELIGHLLYDLHIATQLSDFWSLRNEKFPQGFVGAFLSTVGGLTSIYPKSDELIDYFMNQRDTWKASYFKRTIDSDDTDLILSAPYLLTPDATNVDAVADITLTKSITLNVPGKHYKVAVNGVVYTHAYIEEQMTSVLKSEFMNEVDCSKPDKLACHLLDDGGFLISTNQPHFNTSVGRFFGKVDAEVMRELYNQSVYERLEQYEYKATCEHVQQTDITSAATFNIPTLTLFYEMLTFNWWSSMLTWSVTNFNIYNMLYPSTNSFAEGALLNEKTYECDRKKAQYYFTGLKELQGQTDCHIRNLNCSRDFSVRRVEKTNLLLVITEPVKDDCDMCIFNVNKDDIIQEPTEISAQESNDQFCSLKPRYRRPTSNCYDHDPREDETKCRGSLTHPVSFLFTSLVSMATVVYILR